MALPTTITNGTWPLTGSGNFGPFFYGGNVYVVSGDSSGYPTVYKATDPTSSFSEQDASNNPTPATAANYMDAHFDGTHIHIMWVRTFDTYYAQFDCSTDKWVDSIKFDSNWSSSNVFYYKVYTATDYPTTYWGGITVRSDGDIIIVHPGENPTTMGGEYQEVAYSRAVPGSDYQMTSTTRCTFDATNNKVIDNSTSGNINWGDNFVADDYILVKNAGNSENDGWYILSSITTTDTTDDTLNFDAAYSEIQTNTTIDTTAHFGQGMDWTAGVVVASTATKNDNYWYAYPVMGSSDQCHFGYVRDTTSDFYLRALSSGNALRTQRSYASDFAVVNKGVIADRGGTETIYFQVSDTGDFIRSINFNHFTDDSSPTMRLQLPENNVANGTLAFTASFATDLANTSEPVYCAYVDNIDFDIEIVHDQGNSSAAALWTTIADPARTGTVDGISGNIYERDGNRLYAFVYDDNGTTKYDEYTLYATAEALTATDISSATTVGNPAITQNHSATATGIDSQPTVGNPAITQNHSATATAISSTPTTGTPLAGEVNPLTATEISSTPITDTPALTQEHALTATEISSGTAVESSPITQNHNLNNELVENGTFPNDISGWTDQNGTTSSWNAGRIQVDCIDNIGVTYQAVTTTENTWYRFAYDFVQKQSGGRIFLSSSGIGGSNKGVVANQVSGSFNVWMGPGETTLWISLKNSADAVVTLIYDDLSLFPVTDIDSASEVEAPSIQARAELTATAISSIPVNDTSPITQVHNLTATAISSTPELNTTSITQEHALGTPTGLSSTPVLDVTGITQTHQLAVTEVASTPVLDTPTLTELNQLTATEISSTSRTRGPVLVDDASIAGLQHYEANIAYSISTTSSVSAWHTMYGSNTNCVVACMSFMSGDNVASPGKTYNVTFDGQAMTLGSAYTVPDIEFVSLIYYLTEPPGGNSQLSISTNDEFRNITVSLIELSGINPIDPVGNNQSSSTETVGITPKTANSIIVGVRTQKEIGQGGVTPSTDNIEIIDYQGGGS